MLKIGQAMDEITWVAPPVTNSEANPLTEPIESCALCIEHTTKLGDTSTSAGEVYR